MNVHVRQASAGVDPTSPTSMAERPRDPRPNEREIRGPFGGRAVRLGRVFGIEIGLDWSWLFIFLLITLSLSRWFTTDDPPLDQTQAWIAAILGSVLFFVSILLHEFGHSLTARALGIRVHSITLFLF